MEKKMEFVEVEGCEMEGCETECGETEFGEKKSIEMKNVSKNFGEKLVLDQISFSVSYSEIFGLLGPSGAGKTTMIKILTGQIQVSDGEAYVLGTDTRHITDEIYSKIGMVLDDQGLYERLSCYYNLKMFVEIYDIDKANIERVLAQVGLMDAMKKPVSQLSKGMKQRLILARAIMHNPQLLFLDEPTSGLDPATALEIHQLIFDLRDSGTTIFLTTHNMAEATKLCDNVALLNEGKIVEYGAPDEICRKYNPKKIVSLLLKDGQILDLPIDRTSSEKIAEMFENEFVESIHSSEPNLETVFIQLTGRKLEI
ncbi:ABC transporter ATP-binding protein [[Clostridium] fimetarium]|uniref:ABC-2 type transport system ATP-binding protein n=1 Tax=[Clostridium] fimetarium TaxID=99656 RepID=A0A1I0NS77_9FIRM|nr:ABC transporter ATP-binding protein [[Clostridium] fimetarium]SEW04463.1 ABC-2 type transport system ATP-binding protein [[Clostridium] fimetarium]